MPITIVNIEITILCFSNFAENIEDEHIYN